MRTPWVPDALRHAPFTLSEAVAHGLSKSSLQSPVWWRVMHGVWAHVDLPDNRELRLNAVRLVLADDSFICGLTTAWVHGIDVQDRRAESIWIGRKTGAAIRARSGCLIREITVEPSDLEKVGGVLMTTPVRTAFDCGRWLALPEGVVVADYLAHAGLFTAGELASYAQSHRALRGVRRLDRVVDLLEPLSESAMESRVRVRLVEGGLPAPTAQLVICDRIGRFVARADLAYIEQRVIVEYDGALHWEQRRADDRRRDQIRALGWTVIVLSREDYYGDPMTIVTMVARALRSSR